MNSSFPAEKSPYRQRVWNTTLGVRAKMVLLALVEIADIDGDILTLPPDCLVILPKMLGRSEQSVIHNLMKLVKQRIVTVDYAAHQSGRVIYFQPENEPKRGTR